VAESTARHVRETNARWAEKTSAKTGIPTSRSTVERLRYVLRHAALAPDIAAGVRSGDITPYRAYLSLRQLVREHVEQVKASCKGCHTPEDFWSRVDICEPNRCWNWTRSATHSYGCITYQGKLQRAHRLAYVLAIGPIPADKPLALHKPRICHNRLCCNPAHLYAGDNSDNHRDRLLDGTSNRVPQVVINAVLDREKQGSTPHTLAAHPLARARA
jgi:hypothetical protein